MVVNTANLNARQFLQLGQDPPGLKLELVNGEVALSPGPIPTHSFAVKKLASILISHTSLKKLWRK
jgi:hypothetical protein